MTTQILFTNDAELLSIEGARPARGEKAFQIDALYIRKDDGACVVNASIPDYIVHEGRSLKAYASLVLAEFPESLKDYVQYYDGRIKPLFRADGTPILGRDGQQVKGHQWSFPGQKPASSIQLREGAVLCYVEEVRLSSNQPSSPSAPANYTVNFAFEIEPGSTFGPWGSGSTKAIQETTIERSFLASLRTANTAPASKKRAPKKANDNGMNDVPLF